MNKEMDRYSQIHRDVAAIVGASSAELIFASSFPVVTQSQWVRLGEYIRDFETTEWPIGELKTLMVATKAFRDVRQVAGPRAEIVKQYDALKAKKQ